MQAALSNWSPEVLAAVFAVMMLVSWGIGWWSGRLRSQPTLVVPGSKMNDALLALLGLLLAFTFSMALARYERRRELAVADSNAIGDFWTSASFLRDPIRGRLQSVLRQYVEVRLEIARKNAGESLLQQKLEEIRQMHGEMQQLVKEAIDSGTPVVVALVMSLNEVTSRHATRLAAVHDRLPVSIVLLLSIGAVLCVGVTGRQQQLSQEWRPGVTAAFILLVTLVMWVTLDLDQPQRGWITVSQEPMEQLLKGMDLAHAAGPSN